MKDPASPSWKRVKVIVTKTGDNFLLSHADLKNLGLLPVDFPEYIGERRMAHVQSTKREEELSSPEYGYFTSTIDDDGTEDREDEVTVSQSESAVAIEFPEDFLEAQVTEIEAYAALYAIGGYTFDNLVQEDSETCNSANTDATEEDSDPEEEDDGIAPDKAINEEELIKTKSPYEQKFIREFRQLFSETLNPSRYLKCPPMKIKLKQALSSKLDPSLYKFRPRLIPMHIREQAQQLLNDLVEQGIIRRLGPNETSDVCAPAGFVPKKSKKLRFIIDFTSLNKYIERPVHSFPSTDQIQQAI